MKRTKPQTLEQSVQAGIFEALAIHGFLVVTKSFGFEAAYQVLRGSTTHVPGIVWRRNAGGRVIPETPTRKRGFLRAGFGGECDIDGILSDGRRLAIEVKRPGGKPRPDQLAYMECIRRMGGVVWIYDDVDHLLRSLALLKRTRALQITPLTRVGAADYEHGERLISFDPIATTLIEPTGERPHG